MEQALRLDRLSGMFDPDVAANLDSKELKRLAALSAVDARDALIAKNIEGALIYSLTALAFDPGNSEATRQLAAATQEFNGRCDLLNDSDLSQNRALDVAVGAALGAPRFRWFLLDLLQETGDAESSALLSSIIASDDKISVAENLELMKAARIVRRRRQGDDPATAEMKAAADISEHLVQLGPPGQLTNAQLDARIRYCFSHLGYRRTLEDLRELRRRDPDDDWAAFNLCKILMSSLHPDVQASADLVVRRAGEDFDDLSISYRMMSMMGATPQALALAERLSKHDPQYAIVGMLHKMATDLDARPVAVFGRPRQGRRLLYANLVAWGEAYVDLLEQGAIPSLLAPGNIPALAEHVDLVVELFTMPDDLSRLLESPALQRLGRHCEVRVHALPDNVAALRRRWGYTIYGYVTHATLLRAERDGADVTFLMPDLIYADGGYGAVAARVSDEPRALFADGLNTYAGPMLERMRPFRQDATLSVPSESLIEAALGCLSERTLQSLYRPGDHRTCDQPTRVIFPLETGLRVHGFMMMPIYVSHAALAPFRLKNFSTQDGLFLEHVLNGVNDDQLEVLSSAEFCYVEVCENDGSVRPMRDVGVARAIRDFFVDFGVGRNRLRLFRHAIEFPTRSPPSLPLVNVAEANARLREIVEMFATDPLMVDLAEEQESVRRAFYRA
jgi:hypothetical protein